MRRMHLRGMVALGGQIRAKNDSREGGVGLWAWGGLGAGWGLWRRARAVRGLCAARRLRLMRDTPVPCAQRPIRVITRAQRASVKKIFCEGGGGGKEKGKWKKNFFFFIF